jgi:hypothetical protein
VPAFIAELKAKCGPAGSTGGGRGGADRVGGRGLGEGKDAGGDTFSSMSPPKSSPPKRRASALEEMNVLANLMGIQVAQAEEEMKPIKCVPPRASVLWGRS